MKGKGGGAVTQQICMNTFLFSLSDLKFQSNEKQ